jgi:hypothetical protein
LASSATIAAPPALSLRRSHDRCVDANGASARGSSGAVGAGANGEACGSGGNSGEVGSMHIK